MPCSMREQTFGVLVYNPSPAQERLTDLVEQPPKIVLHLLSTVRVLGVELPVLRHER